MGTLAGSTIMLLTIAWSGRYGVASYLCKFLTPLCSVFVGRCNLNKEGKAMDKTLTRSHKYNHS